VRPAISIAFLHEAFGHDVTPPHLYTPFTQIPVNYEEFLLALSRSNRGAQRVIWLFLGSTFARGRSGIWTSVSAMTFGQRAT
jgi:hypothetical protein